jgi:hypothetical protein
MARTALLAAVVLCVAILCWFVWRRGKRKTMGFEPNWNYLLALDSDLAHLSRYVEFSANNFKCFSIELASILLAAASEVDVACKQLCKKVNPNSTADNINQYRDELAPAFPQVKDFKVVLPRFGLTFCPWDEWNKPGGVPPWWTSYNKVKHQRDVHFDRATLENAISAVAGLFVILLYLYKENATLAELAPPPQVLHVEDKRHGGVDIGGPRGVAFSYQLD